MPDRSPVIPRRVLSPMTGRLTDCPRTATENPEAWLRAIAGGLSTAGLPARLDDPQATRAVTVTVRLPGSREADLILDEDGYADLRWWPGPDTTPAEVTGVITRLVAIIAAPARGAEPATAQPATAQPAAR